MSTGILNTPTAAQVATTHYDYLIVGGGMVADAAARGIRDIDERGSIGILSADVDEPYTRPALSKKLWTDPDFTWDQVPLGTAQATGAEISLETPVVAIDRGHKLVTTARGDLISYDELLLATGGIPQTIEAPDDDRVLTFRSAEDYHRLRELARPGARAVVIGGGYIGSELAAALVQNGPSVTLVHPDATLGAPRFPRGLAAHHERLFRDAGVDVRGGRRAERVDRADGELHVVLDDGQRIPADVVVIGLGTRPAVDLAEHAQLIVDDGVIVDEYLRTSDPSIWAAGDIASYPDPILGQTRVEHVDNAREMGETAGRSMAGDTVAYAHTPYFYSAVFGHRWEAVGRTQAELETIEEWTADGERCAVYYLDDGHAVGVLLWGVENQLDAAREVIAEALTRSELVHRIPLD